MIGPLTEYAALVMGKEKKKSSYNCFHPSQKRLLPEPHQKPIEGLPASPCVLTKSLLFPTHAASCTSSKPASSPFPNLLPQESVEAVPDSTLPANPTLLPTSTCSIAVIQSSRLYLLMGIYLDTGSLASDLCRLFRLSHLGDSLSPFFRTRSFRRYSILYWIL